MAIGQLSFLWLWEADVNPTSVVNFYLNLRKNCLYFVIKICKNTYPSLIKFQVWITFLLPYTSSNSLLLILLFKAGT